MSKIDYMSLTSAELRPHILAACLNHVPFDGWSTATLKAGAKELGISAERAELAFPGKGKALMLAYLADVDERHKAMIAETDMSALKIREKITACLHMRFAINGEHKEAVHRLVTTMALPHMAPHATRAKWKAADIMWRGIGDTSTDYNYYTKRVILGGVYAASLVYWLSDQSEDHADTWAFIDRRIEDVMKIEKAKASVRKIRENAPSLSRFLGRLRYGAGR